MRTRIILLFLTSMSAIAQNQVNRHKFNAAGYLSEAASGQDAGAIGQRHLQESGLDPSGLAGTYIAKRYQTSHNGVTHLVYRQRFRGLDVFNADYTVNIDRDGRVINAGGQLAPAPGNDLPAPDLTSVNAVLKTALSDISPARAARQDAGKMVLGRTRDGRAYLFGDGPRTAEELIGEPGWVLVKGQTRAAWKVSIADENGVDFYQSIVDASGSLVVAKRNLTAHQRARVFTGSGPQPNPKPGTPLTEGYSYVNRVEVPLTGDPQASPRGWVTGNRTVGNNVLAGFNPQGSGLPLAGDPTIASPDGNFFFPLELGPGQGSLIPYKDATTTNLFYWMNRAHDLFYSVGFDEAAGNYQQDNFGRGGIGGDAIIANSEFGSLAATQGQVNNAFYTTRDDDSDGAAASINMFVSFDPNTGLYADGSLDSEVMLHEYGHGVSHRLIRQLSSHQGGSMGEAWSDFFALEFTLPEGAPADGIYPVGEYLQQGFGVGIRSRPYSTRMDVNPLTFAELGRVYVFPEVHADGEIWMQVLWEMRAALIQQFGEKEGRRRVRLLVMDGMKLSPPNPGMIEMRDSILLADRVDFQGASQDALWGAFAKRGLGALAQSFSPDSTHIAASFVKPGPLAQLGFYESHFVLGEPIRVVLSDANNPAQDAVVQLTTSSGDLETVTMHRDGSVFTGFRAFSGGQAPVRNNVVLEAIPNDAISAYYLDQDTGAGAKLVEATVSTGADYAIYIGVANIGTASGAETRLFPSLAGRSTYGNIAVSLPFAFPFYGQQRKMAWIGADGLIAFDALNIYDCKDWSTLGLLPALAPMWMDLAYQSTATRDENVFMSRGPDSVTFRWAAQTQVTVTPPPFGQVPDPVNFSATLFADGRAQFVYGDGNKNLSNIPARAVTFGCTSATPTVGVSSGHENKVLLSSTLTGRANLERAPTLTILPPFGSSSVPEVRLETPKAGDQVSGTMRLTGVAFDRAEFVSRIDVLIDGVAKTRVTVNTLRPDVCATDTVAGCPSVGFNSVIDLTALRIAPGNHNIRLRIVNARGGWGETPEVPFEVTAGAGETVQAVFESPAADSETELFSLIRGWVHAGSLRLAAVDLVIDGVTSGPVVYGLPRTDICSTLTPAPANCPAIGFLASLSPLARLQPGRHTLQLRVRDESGRVSLAPSTPHAFTVTTPANRPPTGVVESPKPNDKLKGVVRISGYAYDPDGRILSAAILVNGGLTVANLQYGVPSPEACANLPDVARCPNIGFQGDFDTTRFPNGLYSLGVRLTDDSGAVVVIPLLGSDGMNVTIEN